MSGLDRRNFLKLAGLIGVTAAMPFSFARAADKPLVVGFVYVGARDDFGYNQAHAQAARIIRSMPNVKVIEEENVPETSAVQQAMEAMIRQDGAELIFATSFGYFDPHVLRVAQRYPNVRFAHCGGLWDASKHSKNVGSFFGYIDEGQYLNGVVAGHMSKTKRIGFIAAKPVAQVLRNVNAFTLGARSVDPEITTTVIFTGDWSLPVREAEAANGLIDQGCDVLTCHVDGPKVIVETAERRGVMSCGYHASQAALAPKGYLTGAEWNWETPYRAHVEAAQQGQSLDNFLRGGLAQGFVKSSAYGDSVSAAARAQADQIRAAMIAGEFTLFKGPLKDNKGNVVLAEGESLGQTDVVLEQMNYLVEGVRGDI
ncbi:BMP family ABC transporter substrate-binding protein [Pseudomonas sp. gcc21]|uniref:BMP family ABC transporter substrate-binding protein n=1 Tax=Pseudomonas sp. gcc21 TaxID=2726989 RepID=UPI0014517E27|nr:BMP family ABC transporter substrate-binding protein [Pseudomonas sp. gcc21]QJD57434.1 BMP family ABC transporter substrate-binding protein [Pseudomonas sp. gcc21]